MEKRDVLPSFGAATKQQEEHNMTEKTSQGYDTRIIEAAKLSIRSLCWNAQTRKTQSF